MLLPENTVWEGRTCVFLQRFIEGLYNLFKWLVGTMTATTKIKRCNIGSTCP